MVPLQAFPISEHVVLEVTEWMCTLCWTLDLPLSFRTGYYSGSVLEMRPGRIARRYAQTWLALDIFIVALEWVTRFSTAMPSGSSLARATRILRILRCVRLLRIAKMQVLWSVIQDQINSSMLYLCLGLLKMSTALAIVAHVTACVWYALGEAYEDGWPSYYGISAVGGSMNVREQYGELVFWYFASSRWTLAQINGRTDVDDRRNMPELMFTCFVAVGLAVIFMTVFYGSVCSTMMELSTLTESKTRARRLVNSYLKRRMVSSQLVGSVKHLLASQEIGSSSERDEQDRVLQLLPPDLAHDLLYEVRQPVLSVHRWFSSLNREFPRAVRHVCYTAVRQVWTYQREVVFERGDACNRMLFVENGRMHYQDVEHWDLEEDGWASISMAPEVFDAGVALSKGQWISEPALWVEWVNRGRLVAGPKGCLMVLEATDFAKLLREYRSAYAIAVLYAKDFVAFLQQSGATSDIVQASSAD